MEESVALDSSKQKQFVKSVRGIKKLLKKNSNKVKESELTKKLKPNKEIKPEKKLVLENEKKVKKVKKIQKRADRGLVYLSHIPHGFYEQQMTEYFKQFGVVTNARVIRSKYTGNSKGYAFVEFKEPSVAEIVAETMNNYLMGKRLIKAVYIPPKKQKVHAMRKNWNFQNNPSSEHRLKMKKALNADKSDKEELLIAKRLLSNLSKTKEKLRGLGIDYNFFVPVDVPEVLNEKVEKCKDEFKDIHQNTIVESKQKIKVEEKITKSKQKTIKAEPIEIKDNIVDIKKENKKNKNKKQNKNNTDTKSNEKQLLKENKNLTKNKNSIQKKDKKEHSLKQNKLKETSIKEPVNFIKTNESDDSDNSLDFDSDEFEKIIANDDDELSSTDESDDLNKEVEQKLDNVKEKIKPNAFTKEKNISKTTIKYKKGKGSLKNMPQKRKNNSNASVTPKKAKFEKQTKKTLNKVVKKKK